MNISLLSVSGFGSVIVLFYSWLGLAYTPPIITIAILLNLVSLVALRSHRNVDVTSFMGLSAVFISIGTASIEIGGLDAVALAWWLVVPVMAGFLNGFRGLVFWTLAVWAAILALGLGHQQQLIPPRLPGHLYYLQSVVALITALGTVSCLVGAFAWDVQSNNRALADSLKKLEAENASRKMAEAEANHALTARERFLVMMSHELRTPLNGVLGPNQLLEESDLTEGQRELVAIALKSTRALGGILDDILDFANLDAGRIELNDHTFDLRELIEQAAYLVRTKAKRKGVSLTVHTDPALPERVYGDASRVRQVLLHLLTNAEKYTHTGDIWIEVECRPEGTRFCITDTGIGMDEDTTTLLFEAFARGRAASRSSGGAGLGLPICRNLVALMGGELTVESTPGEGTRFYFTIKTPPAPKRIREQPRRKDTGSLPLKVLVAEDNIVNQRVVARILEEGRHTVVTVCNGEEAVAAAARQSFDLILMDMLMPVVDGLEATRRIREHEPLGRRTPIVALTASAGLADRDACLLAGMDDFIPKPIDVPLFRERMAHWQDVTRRERVLTW